MTAVEELQQLGFSQYEAQAYTTLLQRSPLNGYELAKLSGIPRPNVYSVLHKLEERGAIMRLDLPEGTRYAPVASDELLHRLHLHYQSSLETVRRTLEQVEASPEQEYIWNARGYPALLDHARSFIDSAKKQLWVAVWPQEARALEDHLKVANNRGVNITTLCLAGCPQECGSCRGRVYRKQATGENDNRWLLVIPDETEVLAGEIGLGGYALAVRTRQRLLVNLAGLYIHQSIALSTILLELNDRLDDLLGPECRATLQALGSSSPVAGWIDQMHLLLHPDDNPIENSKS